MNLEDVDSYFINKQYFDKVIKKGNKEKLYNKKDLKFYRKRIFELIKNILEGKEENQHLKETLDVFIKESIEHLKLNDKTSLLQENYDNDKKEKPKKEVIKESLITKVEEGNRVMFRNLNPKSQDIEKSLGIKRIKKKEEEIIPKQKELNLRDPKFKKRKKKKEENKKV